MKRFQTNTSGSVDNGTEILAADIKQWQDGPQEECEDIVSTFFNDGIVYTSSPIPFALNDNGNGTFTIGSGVGYKSGERIEILDSDTTAYNANNPTTESNDGIGGTSLTPLSTGNTSIPIPVDTTYYVGIKYLQSCDPTKYSLHPATGQRKFKSWNNGYIIELQDNVSLIEGLVIGTVIRGSTTSLTINYNGRTYATIKTEVNRTAADVLDNTITTAKVVNFAITEEKLALGVGFASGTRIVFCQATAPIGWTQDTTFSDRALRVTSGEGNVTGGSVGFSTSLAHSHTVNSHTHTISHTHTYSGTTSTYNPEYNAAGGGNTASPSHAHTYSGTTSGSSSANSGTASDSGTNSQLGAFKYIDVIICQKD